VRTSDQGIALLKKHEGLRLKAYPDPASGGEPWTIGYGTTSSAGVGKITKGMTITQAQAEDMLRRSLVIYERGVVKALNRAPTQTQFDALVSFAYNVGVPAMSKSSVIRHYNAGDTQKAADSFLLWNKAAGKVMPGLTRRRSEERALFLKASAPATVTPAPIPAPAPVPPPAQKPIPDPVAPKPPGQSIARAVIIALGTIIAAAAAWIIGGK
jgi:lysozyme